MFRMHVANVDRDVAYIPMVVHVVANICSLCFICLFKTYVESVFIRPFKKCV
jgi:hypothetical protein